MKIQTFTACQFTNIQKPIQDWIDEREKFASSTKTKFEIKHYETVYIPEISGFKPHILIIILWNYSKKQS